MKIEITPKALLIGVVVSLTTIAFLLYFKLNSIQHPDIPVPETSTITGNVNLVAIFLTGLFTGALTCLAVQGGLLATTIAQREEEKMKEKTINSGNALPILAFVISKLIAYTILGVLLGFFGSLFQLSLTMQIIMQVAVAVFMLGTAFNILNVHPIFRYFVIQPPRKFTRLVRKRSKSNSIFAPAVLGAFTVLIPCGTTQAMMALAIGTGSPTMGAAVLFAFVLGTSPLFFTLGYFATKIGDTMHQKFMKVAAFTLILLAIFNLNNVLALTGNPITLKSLWSAEKDGKKSSQNTQPQQDILINVLENGYSPNIVTVKAGEKVNITLKNDGIYTCATAFTIPYFNYQKVVQIGTSETVTLQMPDMPTQIPFMCSMGMYRGVINVI